MSDFHDCSLARILKKFPVNESFENFWLNLFLLSFGLTFKKIYHWRRLQNCFFSISEIGQNHLHDFRQESFNRKFILKNIKIACTRKIYLWNSRILLQIFEKCKKHKQLTSSVFAPENSKLISQFRFHLQLK